MDEEIGQLIWTSIFQLIFEKSNFSSVCFNAFTVAFERLASPLTFLSLGFNWENEQYSRNLTINLCPKSLTKYKISLKNCFLLECLYN